MKTWSEYLVENNATYVLYQILRITEGKVTQENIKFQSSQEAINRCEQWNEHATEHLYYVVRPMHMISNPPQ